MDSLTFDNYSDHKICNASLSIGAWSPRVDILFIGSTKGDFYIYRLPMTLIWRQNEKVEGSVTSVSWHCDGFIIAVGFESGKIKFYSVQHNNCIHSIKLDNPVNFMRWTEYPFEIPYPEKNIDNFSKISELYQSSLYEDEMKKFDELLKINEKQTLLYGISGDAIFLLSNGLFYLGKIELKTIGIEYTKLHDVYINTDFNRINLVVENAFEESRYNIIEHEISCMFIKNNLKSINIFSDKFIRIIHLEKILEIQLQELEENWDDVLNSFNSLIEDFGKLFSQSSNPFCLKSTVLELILFGNCESEIWKELQKSFKKPEHERLKDKLHLSQLAISSFCINLTISLIQLSYYYNQLLNLTTNNAEFQRIFVDRVKLKELTDYSSLSLLKLHELQKVIKEVDTNITSFVSWFYNRAVLHDTTPSQPELNSNNCKDEKYIPKLVEFITTKLEPVYEESMNSEEPSKIINFKMKAFHKLVETDETKLPYLISPDNHQDEFFIQIVQEAYEEMKENCSYSINGMFGMKNEVSLYQLFNNFYKKCVDDVFILKKQSDSTEHLRYEEISIPRLLNSGISTMNTDDCVMIARKIIDNNTKCMVTACFDPLNMSLFWIRNDMDNHTISSVTLKFDHINQSQKIMKLLKMEYLTEDLLICLISTMTSNQTSYGSYLVMLNWNDISSDNKDFISTSSSSKNIPDQFGKCMNLSELSNFKVEHLPRDAKSMVINFERGVIVVLFGKTYERCRIFMINS